MSSSLVRPFLANLDVAPERAPGEDRRADRQRDGQGGVRAGDHFLRRRLYADRQLGRARARRVVHHRAGLPYGKRPAITGWPQRATCDPEQLAAWWQRAPYNIGIHCGAAGFLVIDLDQPRPKTRTDVPAPGEWAAERVRDGRDVLAVLARRAGEPDPRDTYTVATPRGEQRYFTVAAPASVNDDGGSTVPEPVNAGRCTAGVLGWLVDTRAAGGYVIASGSVRWIDGRRRYYRRVSPAQTPTAAAPHWRLEALIRPPRRTPAAQAGRRAGSLRTSRRPSTERPTTCARPNGHP